VLESRTEVNMKKEIDHPKCPECGADARRPRCLFELGGDCPRHEALKEWKQKNSNGGKGGLLRNAKKRCL
jgi:hypothetical protein